MFGMIVVLSLGHILALTTTRWSPAFWLGILLIVLGWFMVGSLFFGQ